MSSLRSQLPSEFDITIGRELKNWGDRQKAPGNARAQILEKAAQQPTYHAVKIQFRLPAALRKLHALLFETTTTRRPDMPYAELTRWLAAQAAWQHLGNDRRAVRFVC